MLILFNNESKNQKWFKKLFLIIEKLDLIIFFKEFFEAGIVLKGSEVKSLRDGKSNISESYAIDVNGEIFLVNSHIPSYKESSYNDHNPTRNRKLLLNKREINKLIGKINREGLTLIPTKLYF